MRKDSKAIAGLVFRDRIESWSAARNSADGRDQSRTRNCELDVVGNALDDLVLLESEIGEQGILDMVLRNFCWEEDRKRLRRFLRRVATLRLEKKRSTSKKDENKSDVFHQWQGDWKKTRAEHVIADIMWFERARTHGLYVEMETGRWHKIPREQRICTCGKTSPGTAEHAIEFCPLFDDERRKTKIRLRRFGLQDDNIWSLIKKAGGVMKDWPVEVRYRRSA